MHTLPQETINNLKARRITDDDWAFLKSLPDFHEIDEIIFFCSYLTQSSRHMVEISDTEKIFSLGDIPRLTNSCRFVYVKNQSICIFIEICSVDFSIYFHSPELHEEIDFIKKIFSYSIIKFGWDFNENYDVVNNKLGYTFVDFTFTESRNTYFDI